MSGKKIGVIFGAILVAAAAAAGIWYFYGNGGRDSKDRVYVEKVSVVTGSITGVQNRYMGVVQPQETVEINADSERTISEILVAVGDEVTEGTPLFTYDTEDLSLELEQSKLELENQDIEINNYRNQIRDLEKERTAAAEANKFEYTTQIQTIQTQIKQAEFTKSSKQLEMDKIQKRIDNSQVTSTASGVIKSINDGQSQDEESSAFMTILSTGEFRIKGTVNEQNVGMISSGVDVIVRSRVDERITWTGTIESLDTEESSDNTGGDMGYETDENVSASSNYSFFVSMDDTEGLMLGQHVLIELDEGQTEVREGIWLYSGYIVFEGREKETPDGMGDLEFPEDGMGTEMLWDYDEDMDTEMMSDYGDDFDPEMMSDYGDDMDDEMLSDYGDDTDGEMLSDYGDDTDAGMLSDYGNDMEYMGADMLWDTEAGMGTEKPLEGGEPSVYVWADNGSGRLEKRAVEIGEYDAEQDKYEILSGLTEEDLIAWPMEGLYEGVRTVTNIDEVDYTSGLYNQENGTEDLWLDTEFEGMDDGNFTDGNYEDGNYEDGNYEDGSYEDGNYEDGSYEDENNNHNDDKNEILNNNEDKPLDFDDFLRLEGF